MENKSYALEQYLFYRDREQGYSEKDSPGAGRLITETNQEWIRQKLRNTPVKDALTVELQASETADGQNMFALICSMVLTLAYYRDEYGAVETKRIRPEEYSHYLLMQYDAFEASDAAETALKALESESLFIDKFRITAFKESEENEELDRKMLDAGKIRAEWEQIYRQHGEAADWKSEENACAFLARFWENCWKRACGLEVTPLIVIVTETEINEYTLIDDGVIFFVRRVLPFLPDEVKKCSAYPLAATVPP